MKQNIGFDAIKVALSRIITLSISLFTAMLLSRYLTLQEYGTYSQMLLILELVSTLFIIGLPSCINYFVAKEEDKKYRQNFLSIYYSISTLLSFTAGFFLILFSPVIINYFKNPYLKSLLYILAVLPWAKTTISSITNVLVVYGKTNWLFTYQTFHSGFHAIIIMILKMKNLNFYQYMFLFMIIECLFAVGVYIVVRILTGKIFFNLNKDLIREIFRFSIPIGLSTVVATISIQLDKMIIARFFSIEELAIYTNASREIPITFVASSITAVLLPNIVKKLSDKEVGKAIDLWGDASVLSYIIICYFVTILIIFTPEVITVLYSEKFLPGISVFRVYSIVLLLRFTYFGMILNAAGKTKFILYSSIASLGLNVLLNIVFYKVFGFIGPAIATFFSMIIIILIQLVVTSKFINISFKTILPWKKLGYISLINICIGSILYIIINNMRTTNIHQNLVKGIIFVIIWSLAYFLITKKEIVERWKNLNTK